MQRPLSTNCSLGKRKQRTPDEVASKWLNSKPKLMISTQKALSAMTSTPVDKGSDSAAAGAGGGGGGLRDVCRKVQQRDSQPGRTGTSSVMQQKEDSSTAGAYSAANKAAGVIVAGSLQDAVTETSNSVTTPPTESNRQFHHVETISQKKVFISKDMIVDGQLPAETELPPGVKLHPTATSSGQAMMFSINLSNGNISIFFVQGAAFPHENNESLDTGDPVLMESNQHCSTFREVNSIGSLVYFEDCNGQYSIGRIGPEETYIEADFKQDHLSPSFWKDPVSVHSGKSYGFLCQVGGDPNWFQTGTSQHNFPAPNQKDGRIQISRKGATVCGPDFAKFVGDQNDDTAISRDLFEKSGMTHSKETKLWERLTGKKFKLPRRIEKQAIQSQLNCLKEPKILSWEDAEIDEVTGCLSLPLLLEKANDGSASIVYVSKSNLMSHFDKFQENHGGRSHFLSKDEHDEFVSGIPEAKKLDMSVVDIMNSGLKRQYIDLHGELLGCLVGDEEQVEPLSDVSTVERLLKIKQDLIKSKASNHRSPDSKPHVGHQVYSNMHQTGQATPSPTRGPTEKVTYCCKNSGKEFVDELRHACTRMGDPMAANRLCHNVSILSMAAALLGRQLMLSHRIGEKDNDNWRFDLDTLTIDWFNGMHTDKADKHNDTFTEDHQGRIQHVKEVIEGLTPAEVESMESKLHQSWTLDFWKIVIQANEEQKSNRPIAATCTWCDVDLKTKEVLGHDSSKFEIHRHFPFPTTGTCLRLFSKVCLSWFASELEHGTTATVVVDKKSQHVHILGLSKNPPTTIIAWGKGKSKRRNRR